MKDLRGLQGPEKEGGEPYGLDLNLQQMRGPQVVVPVLFTLKGSWMYLTSGCTFEVSDDHIT